MGRRPLGMILRLVGPLIEAVCVVLLVRYGGQGLSIAGSPIEPLMYGGLSVGLVLVIVGLVLSRPDRRRDLEER